MSEELVVGILGAGILGRGVAHSAAAAGYTVILVDLTEEHLARARQELLGSVRLQRILGGPALPSGEVMARITFTLDGGLLSRASLALEAVPETWSAKEPAWRLLDQVCPEGAVMASTTSAIPITRLAALTRRPSQVLGLHFMNPVPMKPMVEMIRGFHTSEATLEAARAFLEDLGKTPVLVADSPGFVSNRVLMLTLNEAMGLVHERVASAEDIDRLFKGCFGHKMGPLETADMIGLDTVLASIEVLQDAFRDDKYRPCPLLRKMVDAGLLGRKSGQGFHAYPAG